MVLSAHSEPWPLIQFRNHFSQTVGLLRRVISPSQSLYLNTGQHKHRVNTYTHQTSIPWVGFEPTIPASEWAKTVHALDRAATVTGSDMYYAVMFSSVEDILVGKQPHVIPMRYVTSVEGEIIQLLQFRFAEVFLWKVRCSKNRYISREV
jgi:hypothetical protein